MKTTTTMTIRLAVICAITAPARADYAHSSRRSVVGLPQEEQLAADLAQEDPDAAGQTQHGSWSHWWSYDGVSGPDYWNINKHWRLCALGRRQSPINIRTERLVYDHLLGPLELDWQPRDGRATATDQLGDTGEHRRQQKQASTGDAGEKQQQQQLRTIPVRLINSGRGLEAWLERAAPFDSVATSQWQAGKPATKTTPSEHNNQQQQQQQPSEQLILARGPLAYEYKLFKLELHSASSWAQAAASGGGATSWSSDDELEQERSASQSAQSSEHLINGRPFEAEVQLHFYNRQLASGAREALRMASERPLASLFAIISVFVSLRGGPVDGNAQDNQGNQTSRSSQEEVTQAEEPLAFLLDHLQELASPGDALELRLKRAQLDALLPDTRQYVTYAGSMTRPPCAESVDWILLNKALLVSAPKFARLFERSDSAASFENVRPVKRLHGRLLRTTISNLAPRRPVVAGAGVAGHSSECAQGHKECVNATLRSHATTLAKHDRRQHCSMRPSYAYEYSFAAKAAAGY